MSTAQQLLDVAGRRRSPATMPAFHAGKAPRNKANATPLTRRPWMRSSRSCAAPAALGTAIVSTV